MKQTKYLLVLLIMMNQNVFCQKVSDTAALVKEFTNILAFTKQPYLYYTSNTKIDASPLLNPKDTISSSGVFYKSNGSIYCNTTKDEMYLEDSLLVHISNYNKTIWVSKIRADGKDGINTLAAVTKKILEVLQKKYIISKVKTPEGLSRISFETRKLADSYSTTSAKVILEYSEETKLPTLISIEMGIKQPIDDDLMASIKKDGMDESKLVQNIGGMNFIVASQRINVRFTNIENTKEKVKQIPSFKEKISWNQTAGVYTGKGIYEGYEITKTF